MDHIENDKITQEILHVAYKLCKNEKLYKPLSTNRKKRTDTIRVRKVSAMDVYCE